MSSIIGKLSISYFQEFPFTLEFFVFIIISLDVVVLPTVLYKINLILSGRFSYALLLSSHFLVMIIFFDCNLFINSTVSVSLSSVRVTVPSPFVII